MSTANSYGEVNVLEKMGEDMKQLYVYAFNLTYEKYINVLCEGEYDDTILDYKKYNTTSDDENSDMISNDENDEIDDTILRYKKNGVIYYNINSTVNKKYILMQKNLTKYMYHVDRKIAEKFVKLHYMKRYEKDYVNDEEVATCMCQMDTFVARSKIQRYKNFIEVLFDGVDDYYTKLTYKLAKDDPLKWISSMDKESRKKYLENIMT